MTDELAAQVAASMGELRRHIHANPELGFQERATSDLVVEELHRAGITEIATGVGGTGVVGTIRKRNGSRAIGIRADMDALPITEVGQRDHMSRNAGVMHACGHDGHTAVLLGAAHLLTATDFDGAVHLIFQPAEEGLGGASRMIEDGLFDRFPMDAVFALHNWPGLEAGKLAIRRGAMMGAVDRFDIEIMGRGAHAAQPHTGIDPVVVAGQLVGALQTIVSRLCAPTAFAVVSVTEISGGTAYNVIPESAILRGTVRTIDPEVRANIEAHVRTMVAGVCSANGAAHTIDFRHGTPPTINDDQGYELLRQAACAAAGPDNVEEIDHSSLAGEDFSYMLQRRPGAFIRLGNGPSADLHNPAYDFNDNALGTGMALWQQLVKLALPAPA